MSRDFTRSLITGSAGALTVAAIDSTAGFVAAGSRFASPAFAAAAAGFVFVLTLALFLAVRWLLVQPLYRNAKDGHVLSVATAMGVCALVVAHDVVPPHAALSRVFDLAVDIALAMAVGVGAHALAVVDSQRTGTTASRVVGRAIPFVMPLALVVAWFAFVQLDDVTSVSFVVLLFSLLAASAVVGRLTAGLTAGAWRAGVLVVAGALFAAGVTGAIVIGSSHPGARKAKRVSGTVRHVILLTVDTLRRDALSCYGSATVSTPNIDRIAARGALLTNVTASSSWTLPSLASMMTGLTTRAHGVNTSIAILPDTVATLAERFRTAGYATRALVANDFLAPSRGFARGFQRYHTGERDVLPVCLGERIAMRWRHEPIRTDTATRDVTDGAIEWVNARRNEDFLLWMHYLDPHLPYAPPEAHVERMNVHDDMGLELGITSATRPTMDLFGDTAARVWARSLYDAEVRYVDAEIGRFLDALDAAGLYEEALIVFGSDHGEEFWDHDGFEHGHTLYNELVGVPLIFKLPGADSAMVIEEPIAIYDVAPTVLELCGLPALEAPRAVSVAARLAGGRALSAARPIFASGTLFRSNFECVVFDGWKYIRSATTGREELFRLADDPAERNSLVLDFPDVTARGRKLIDDHARATEAFRQSHGIANPEIKLDAEEIEKLRALGYL